MRRGKRSEDAGLPLSVFFGFLASAVWTLAVLLLVSSCGERPEEKRPTVKVEPSEQQPEKPRDFIAEFESAPVIEEEIEIDTRTWVVYAHDPSGFTVRYPKEWVTTGGEGGALFGPEESQIGGLYYGIGIWSAKSLGKIVVECETDSRGMAVDKFRVVLDSGKIAYALKQTSKKDPTFIILRILIIKGDVLYVLVSSGYGVKEFVPFYRSFKPAD